MTEKATENKNSFNNENYTTYYCPHCEKPFAQGILLNVKVVCSYCNKFFVIVGLHQKRNS